jgi:hypothetical protein
VVFDGVLKRVRVHGQKRFDESVYFFWYTLRTKKVFFSVFFFLLFFFELKKAGQKEIFFSSFEADSFLI